jgi:F-box-like
MHGLGTLGNLPPEVVLEVLKNLHAYDLLRCQLVSRPQ